MHSLHDARSTIPSRFVLIPSRYTATQLRFCGRSVPLDSRECAYGMQHKHITYHSMTSMCMLAFAAFNDSLINNPPRLE